MDTHDGTGRYVRVVTSGKAIPVIEADVIRATRDGASVLMSTTEGLSDLDTGMDSRNAAIAAWAEGLSQEHGLEWKRVGCDVLFRSLR